MTGDKVNKSECCRENFLFSNVEAWELYSPQCRARWMVIAHQVWRWAWVITFLVLLTLHGLNFMTHAIPADERYTWFMYHTSWVYLLYSSSLLVRAVTSTYSLINQVEEVKWYLKLSWILYEVSSIPALLMTVYFCNISYGGGRMAWYHLVTGGIVLVDFCLVAIPFRLFHFYVPMLFGLVYVIFSVIFTYAGGRNSFGLRYIYKDLDWLGDLHTALITSAILIVGPGVIHCVMFCLYKLRVLLYSLCDSCGANRSYTHKIMSKDEEANMMSETSTEVS